MEKCLNKMHQVVLDEMLIAAQIRCRIPNANNGRAYMGCVVLDRSCPLLPYQVWL
jgi:hypothetical protein